VAALFCTVDENEVDRRVSKQNATLLKLAKNHLGRFMDMSNQRALTFWATLYLLL